MMRTKSVMFSHVKREALKRTQPSSHPCVRLACCGTLVAAPRTGSAPPHSQSHVVHTPQSHANQQCCAHGCSTTAAIASKFKVEHFTKNEELIKQGDKQERM
jgi:hypothetical protein